MHNRTSSTPLAPKISREVKWFLAAEVEIGQEYGKYEASRHNGGFKVE
ncbi:MAG: hypothetical protein P8X51_03925 [Maritimibacter sp.]|jgi:hypothetical protein